MVNSGVLDWYGHLRIANNLNFFILYTLPMPIFNSDSAIQYRIGEIAGKLALTDSGNYGAWEKFRPAIKHEDERGELRAELDALVTLAFDIPDDLLQEIFTADNPTRSPLQKVLDYRLQWRGVQ